METARRAEQPLGAAALLLRCLRTELRLMRGTSKRAAGVAGAGFVTRAATPAIVPGIPAGARAPIPGIDRLMSLRRGFTGNAVATVVVARALAGGESSRHAAGLAVPAAPTE